MTTILGIDPGSIITGYGLVKLVKKDIQYVASGCIRIRGRQTADKLNEIFQGIQQVIHTYPVDMVAVEQVFMHHNVASALKLGQARGVAIMAATTQAQPLAEYSARQIKQSVVGYGGAEKCQVKAMVLSLLALRGMIQADAADALAVALCHAYHLSSSVMKKGA